MSVHHPLLLKLFRIPGVSGAVSRSIQMLRMARRRGSVKMARTTTKTWKLAVAWVALAWVVTLSSQAALEPAAGRTAQTDATAWPRYEPGLVTVYNRPIIILRAPLFDRTPKERAAYIAQRIRSLTTSTQEFAFRPVPEGMAITLEGEIVAMLLPADVDLMSGMNLEQTAQQTVERLRAAWAEKRRQGQVPFLLRAGAATLAATLAFGVIIWVIRRLRRTLLAWLILRERSWTQRFVSSRVRVLERLIRVTRFILAAATWAVGLVAMEVWLVFCCRQFPYTAPWGDQIGTFVFSSVSGLAKGAVGMLPKLFVGLLIFLGAYGITRLARLFFEAVRAGRIIVPIINPQTARPTARLVTIGIWMFALVMMFPYLPGSGSEAFKGVSVFIGLLVSLGATSVMGQFTGGLVLMYSRALQPGDYVLVGEHEGTVISVGFLSTRLRTVKREAVNVPNSVLVSGAFKNFTQLAGQVGIILSSKVTIGYSTPWRQVQALLLEAVRRTPELRTQPPPFVLQRALNDFYVEYEVNAHLDQPEKRLAVLSALHAHIQDAFHENGVQIMSPHYLADPPLPVIAPPEQWLVTTLRERPEAGSPPARPPTS